MPSMRKICLELLHSGRYETPDGTAITIDRPHEQGNAMELNWEEIRNEIINHPACRTDPLIHHVATAIERGDINLKTGLLTMIVSMAERHRDTTKRMVELLQNAPGPGFASSPPDQR
jgi:hypothetical protein